MKKLTLFLKEALSIMLFASVFTVAGTSLIFFDSKKVLAADSKVFFMLPNSTTIRFERRDAPYFVAAMKERMPGTEVIVQNGEGDAALQQKLVEDALTQGANLIVYTSSDANLAAGSLKAAADAGVPVLLYEHDALGGQVEAGVFFNALSVGQAQGKRALEVINNINKDVIKMARVKGNQGEYGTKMYEQGQNEFLGPLFDSGKVVVVCEAFTPNWDPVKAQTFAEDCLTKNGGDVDVFLGMNDGTTGGSVAALISQGYDKGEKIVTGGQDATIEAVQFVVQGWQDNTVFKDLNVQATYAADVATAILKGETLPHINGEMDNEFMTHPAAFLPVNNITIDNVSDVVNAGLYTWAEICKGAEETPLCKSNL